jgi:hypothetical protein
MEMVKKTYQITSYALIYSVYAIFFCVQLFFNFEGFSGSPKLFGDSSFKHVAHKEGASKDKMLMKGQSLPSSGGHTIRLNKRFHQENMPLCDAISILLPERYIPLQTPDYYKDSNLPSVVGVTHPLRGPPVVA